MNIIFVSRSKAHFIYYESILSALLAHGHQVQLLFDKKWSEKATDTALQSFLAQQSGILTGETLRRGGWLAYPILLMRELRSYLDYLQRSGQSPFYAERWRKYLPAWLAKLVHTPLLGKFFQSRLCLSLLAKAETLLPSDAGIVNSLEASRPDLVIVSPGNMRFSEEIEYVKAAKSLNIPSFVPVLSWDNLTTKGLFHVLPDWILAWNEAQKREAVAVHGASPERVLVTGAPFFDKWFNGQTLVEERETFCLKLGLSPERPYLVYLGSSKNIARDETWLVRAILEQIRNYPDERVRSFQLVVRPHPANAEIYRSLADSPDVVVWPKTGNLPEDAETTSVLYNTMRHSVAAVGLNTSAMIDAILLDKPCFAMLSEEYSQTQSQAMHFQHLLSARVLGLVKEPDELAEKLGLLLLQGIDPQEECRRRFIREFVRPHGLDVSAGEMAVRQIKEVCSKILPENLVRQESQEKLPAIMKG